MNYIWNNDTLSLHDGDTLVAEIGFSTIDDGNTYVVERTWVSDAYRGQGIAGKITTTFITRVQEEGKNYYLFAHILINLCKNILSMQIY
ncbi:GNAT family N-acetyltransferase [Ligilactobacillus salivarius]